MSLDPSRDYPLGANRPELVRTPGGIPLDELALHDDRVAAAELRATPETLRLQAGVARAVGRTQLADNLLRAAELEAWAAQLDGWEAPGTAAFVREAAQVYAGRGLLAG